MLFVCLFLLIASSESNTTFANFVRKKKNFSFKFTIKRDEKTVTLVAPVFFVVVHGEMFPFYSLVQFQPFSRPTGCLFQGFLIETLPNKLTVPDSIAKLTRNRHVWRAL